MIGSTKVSTHTLHHSYATLLLEDGVDIMRIKSLLGHERIETTSVYKHIVQLKVLRSFSPLDTLYGLRETPFSNDEMKMMQADFYSLEVYRKPQTLIIAAFDALNKITFRFLFQIKYLNLPDNEKQ